MPNRKQLLQDFYAKYAPDQELTDERMAAIDKKYGDNNEQLLRDFYAKYAPDQEVTSERLDAIYNKYQLKKKEPTVPTIGSSSPLSQSLPEVSGTKKTATPSPLLPSGSTSKSGDGKPNLFKGVGAPLPTERKQFTDNLEQKAELEERLLNDPSYTLLSGSEGNQEKRAKIYEQKNEAIAKERGYENVGQLYNDMDEYLKGYLDERQASQYSALRNMNQMKKAIIKSMAAGQPTEQLMEQYNQAVSQYAQAKSKQIAAADQQIKQLRMNLDGANAEDKAAILDQIKQIESGKQQFFLDLKVEAAKIVKQEGLSGNISDQEKVRRYAHALMREKADLMNELGLKSEQDLLSLAKETAYNTFLENPYYNRLLEVDSKIKSVAPIALLNESPITDTEGAWTVFGKTFMQNLVPAAQKSETQQQKTNKTLEGLSIAGVNTENIAKDAYQTLENVSKPYENWSTKDIATMTGATAAFLPKFAVATMLTEGLGSMAAVSPYWRSIKILSERGSLGAASGESALLRTMQANSYGRGLLKTAFKGVEFGTQSQVESMLFNADRDEVNALTGFVGGALGKQAELGMGLSGKAISSFFGSKSPEATNKLLQFAKLSMGKIKDVNALAIGETGEELGEELGNIWQQSENGQEFFSKVGEEFGDPSKALKFFLSSYMMGLVFGAGTEVGKYMSNKSVDSYSKLSPKDKAIADQVISDLKQEQNQAETQAGVEEIQTSNMPEADKSEAIKEVTEQGATIDDVITGEKTAQEVIDADPLIAELEKLKVTETKDEKAETEKTETTVLDSETAQTTDGDTPAATETTAVVQTDVEAGAPQTTEAVVETPALQSPEATAKALEGVDYDIEKLNEQTGKGFVSNEQVAEAYHKAKADGSNPELVKAVEELLGKPANEQGTQKPITKPVEKKPIEEIKEQTPVNKEQELETQEKGGKQNERQEKRQEEVLTEQGVVTGEAQTEPTPAATPKPKKKSPTKKEKGGIGARFEPATSTDFLAEALEGKRVSRDSFTRFGDRNNITPAMRLSWFKKDGGQSIDQIANDLVNDTSSPFYGRDEMEVVGEITDFITNNPTGTRTYKASRVLETDEENKRMEEEAMFAEEQARLKEEAEQESFREETSLAFEIIEDEFDNMTDEQIEAMDKALLEADLETLNKLYDGKQENDNRAEAGETKDLLQEKESDGDIGEVQNTDTRPTKGQLESELKAAESELSSAENNLTKARKSYEKALSESQIDLMGRAKQDELLFKTNLPALNKRVKEAEAKRDAAKEAVVKAKQKLDDFVPPNQAQIDFEKEGLISDDNFIRDENGNILFEPKIEYENTIKTQDGQTVLFNSAINENSNMPVSYMSESEGDVKSVTWVERVIEKNGTFSFTGPNKIKSSKDVAYLFRSLESAVSENSFAVFIDKSGNYKVVYIGTGTTVATMVDQKVIVAASKEFNAKSVVFVHNHPSGNLKPSNADHRVHGALYSTMDAIGVNLLPSVVINLDTGKYTEFDSTQGDFETSVRNTDSDYEKTKNVKTYSFSKQVLYEQSWNKSKVTSSRDAAEFLSRQKRGAVPKVGIIVLDRANNINRYVLIDPNLTAKELTKQVLQEVSKHGESAIISTNADISRETVKYLSDVLRNADMQLLDVVVTQSDPSINTAYKSYADEGLINEPSEKYNTKSVVDALEKLKIDTKGNLNTFGLIPEAWNFTITTIQRAIKAGKSVADAIEAGIKYAKDWAAKNNANFDEAGARTALQKAFNVAQQQATKTPSGGLANTGTPGTLTSLKKQAQQAQRPYLNAFDAVKKAMKELGVPIAEGYLSKKVWGVYKTLPKKVRVHSFWKIGTVTHEVAHWISDTFGIGQTIRSKASVDPSNPNAKLNREIRRELTKIYVEFYPNAKKEHSLRLRVEEGIAVLLQYMVMQPDYIQSTYSTLVDQFIKPTGLYYNTKFTETLEKMNKLIQDYSELLPEQQLGARVQNREQETEKKDKKGFTWSGSAYNQLFNEASILGDIDKAFGAGLSDESSEIAYRRWQTRGHIIATWVRGDQQPLTLDKDGNWKPMKYSIKDLSEAIRGKEKEFDYYLISRRVLGDVNRLHDLENQLAGLMAGFDPDTATKEEIEEIEKLNQNIAAQQQMIQNDDFDIQNATDIVAKYEKEFEKATEMFDYINNEAIMFANKTGLLSSEKLSAFQDNKTYAAFRRVVHDDLNADAPMKTGGAQKSKITAFKTRKGSMKEIVSPIYSQVFHVAEIINRGLQNQIWQKLADMANSDTFIAQNYFEPIETKVSVDKETGMVSYPQLQDSSLIPVWRNGKPKFYKASPELLAMAESMTPQELHAAISVAKYAGQTFSRLTTSANPLFPLVNLPVDTFSAWMNTKVGFVPIVSQMGSLLDMTTYVMKDYIKRVDKLARWYDKVRNKPIGTLQSEDIKLFERYLALGGSTQTLKAYFDMTPDELIKMIRDDSKVKRAVKGIDEATLGLLEIPSNASEFLTRYAEFRLAKKKGYSDDVAMYMASEVSVPFIQKGKLGGKFGQEGVKTIPYFNASLQVLGKFLKTAKEQPDRVALIAGGVAAIMVSATLSILADMDDEDKKLLAKQDPESLSKNIYIPKKMFGGGDGFVKIRVPEQIGWPGALATMAILENQGYKYSAKEYAKSVTAQVPKQFNVTQYQDAFMSWVPQIAKPSIEVITNKKTYPEIRDIVPYYLQKKIPEFQYDMYTSEFSKDLGKLTGTSPMIIDHYIKSQFGKVPGMAIDLLDEYYYGKASKKTGKIVSVDPEDYILRGRQMNTFYKNAEYWAQVKNSIRDMYESGNYSDEDRMRLMQAANYYETAVNVISIVSKYKKEGVSVPKSVLDDIFDLIQILNTEREPYKAQTEIMKLAETVQKEAPSMYEEFMATYQPDKP